MEKSQDLNSHLFSLQIRWLHSASCLCSSFSTAEASWQQSRDSHGSLMLSEGTFSSPQGTAGNCLKTFLAQLPHPCMIPIPTPCPEFQPFLQKASGLLTAPKWNIPTSCTCGFLFYLFLSCGRHTERDPRARWPGWTRCRMFIHMLWNSLHRHVQNCCNQEMSHEMCKRRHINNLFYSLN